MFLIKLFDVVGIAYSVHEAVALRFPLVELRLGLRMHLAPRRLMAMDCAIQKVQP